MKTFLIVVATIAFLIWVFKKPLGRFLDELIEEIYWDETNED